METRTLITFLKAVELKNFLHVAQALDYAPSTVTMQIKNLEEELGFPLFDRIGKKIQLTEFGIKFLPYANKIIALNEEAHFLNNIGKTPQGAIRCGAIESYTSNVLVYHLPLFAKMYPQVSVNLRIGNTAPLFKMLKQGEADVIFCVTDVNTPLDSDFTCLYERPEPLIFAASHRNKLSKLKNISLETILSQPLILSEFSGRYRIILDSLAAKKGLIVKPLMGIENVSAISKLVTSNLGITFLPKYCLKRDIAKKRLTILEVEEEIIPLTFKILINKNKWISPALQAFINFIIHAETAG